MLLMISMNPAAVLIVLDDFWNTPRDQVHDFKPQGVLQRALIKKSYFPHIKYKEIQTGSVAKSYRTNGLLMYG